jgi:hypothetical protein
MHSQSNLPSHGADRRLEALVKKQAQEHEHVISSYHKEMQTLRDALKLSIDKFESLYQRSDQEFKEKSSSLGELIHELQDKVKNNAIIISEHDKAIKSIHNGLCDIPMAFVTKSDLDVVKSNYDAKLKSVSESHLTSFQTFQQDFKGMLSDIKNDLSCLIDSIGKTCQDLDEKIDGHYTLLKMDKDGVLKEVRIFEKIIFIIEKKIENIYTLIERINNKG